MALFSVLSEIDNNNNFILTISPMPTDESRSLAGFFEKLTAPANERTLYDQRINNIKDVLNAENIACNITRDCVNDTEYYKLSVHANNNSIIRLLEEASSVILEMATSSDKHYKQGITANEIREIINRLNNNNIANDLENHFANLLNNNNAKWWFGFSL